MQSSYAAAGAVQSQGQLWPLLLETQLNIWFWDKGPLQPEACGWGTGPTQECFRVPPPPEASPWKLQTLPRQGRRFNPGQGLLCHSSSCKMQWEMSPAAPCLPAKASPTHYFNTDHSQASHSPASCDRD
ncbi:period circadian protein-like protein 3 [Platysternon megacephalum]|uniref:Period circadian protein-like protein 3 n=1 Tax=Platysternon megacephalum TaxID=55544 RepID=A0A4D9F3J2_9SAUR|nr:period circadian protein-like protein 3 [Platysternon megacephalum]